MYKIKTIKALAKKTPDAKQLYSVTLEDGKQGLASGDYFADKKDGDEIDVELKEAKPYNGVMTYYFNPKKAKTGFPQKDWSFEKRKAALECAVQSSKVGMNEPDDVIKIADYYLQWLSK